VDRGAVMRCRFRGRNAAAASLFETPHPALRETPHPPRSSAPSPQGEGFETASPYKNKKFNVFRKKGIDKRKTMCYPMLVS
jgi:hypothetical protein